MNHTEAEGEKGAEAKEGKDIFRLRPSDREILEGAELTPLAKDLAVFDEALAKEPLPVKTWDDGSSWTGRWTGRETIDMLSDLGKLLYMERMKRGISTAQAAREMKMSVPTLWRYSFYDRMLEKGEARVSVSARFCKAMAEFLHNKYTPGEIMDIVLHTTRK